MYMMVLLKSRYFCALKEFDSNAIRVVILFKFGENLKLCKIMIFATAFQMSADRI